MMKRHLVFVIIFAVLAAASCAGTHDPGPGMVVTSDSVADESEGHPPGRSMTMGDVSWFSGEVLKAAIFQWIPNAIIEHNF